MPRVELVSTLGSRRTPRTVSALSFPSNGCRRINEVTPRCVAQWRFSERNGWEPIMSAGRP
jgi:hypothetical protein